jgi:hypothetical protein
MIRPLTIATCLLACGSGLYLYQSKHEVQVLDHTIERTVRDTGSLREQSRLLAAEWTMLNDPERLQQFSDSYLRLKPIAPPQFTSMADLNSRLPAPLPEAPAHGTDQEDQEPVAADTAPPSGPDAAPTPDTAVVADEALPVPPIPSAPAVASTARPADTRTADRTGDSRTADRTGDSRTADRTGDTRTADRTGDTRTGDRAPASRQAVADSPARSVTVADARPYNDQRAYEQRAYDQRAYDQRQAEQRVAPRIADTRPEVRTPAAPSPRPIVLAAPRPLPAVAPVNTSPTQYRPPVGAAPSPYGAAPYGGSLLGMARGSTPPAPRPTPVNAAYNAN